MNHIYLVETDSALEIISKKASSSRECLSEKRVDLKVYKDSDLILLDQVIEDHTRRTHKYDGLITLDLVDIIYPTKEYLEYFCDFLNYYSDSADIVLKASEQVLKQLEEAKLLKYSIQKSNHKGGIK